MLLLLLLFCGLIHVSEETLSPTLVSFQTYIDAAASSDGGLSGTRIVIEGAPPGAGLRSRSGSATKTHSCNNIRGLPTNLRYASEMFPYGLTQFYQKYTEAYGIPVVSSNSVPDDALKRACYVLRFMMADHSGIRNNFYRRYGRVGVMADTEVTTDIPEHSWLEPVFWNARARGLGATLEWPISTGAEENILCYAQDQYAVEDIFLHEFAHGVHLLGANFAISGFDNTLRYWFNSARSKYLWYRTYAWTDHKEYFAEGVQSFFNVNAYANPANGIHNHVSTNDVLATYDPNLYGVISQVWPCRNIFIKRCEKSRAKEAAQRLLLNCNEGDGEREGDDDDPNPKPECKDLNTGCSAWSNAGYCTGTHEEYMTKNCKKSCSLCGDQGPEPPQPDCENIESDEDCEYWQGEGYCTGKYEDYMEKNCMKSCDTCSGDEDVRPPACYDRYAKKCSKKEKKGHCSSKPTFMLKNCKKSCKMCLD